MKINNKVLSVPPYISTSWNYVDGLYMKGATLVITLFGGESVNIPGLKPEIIQSIFAAHAESLEQEVVQQSSSKLESSQVPGMPFGVPLFSQAFPLVSSGDSAFQLGISSMDGFGSALQHNPSQADAPDIPSEILQKIGAIVRIVAPEEVIGAASAEPDCNCPHCQITRVISSSFEEGDCSLDCEGHGVEVEIEEPEPLPRWRIQREGENLYSVVDHKDEAATEYRVFLGEPIGCTCGKHGCEHIVAVLKS